MPMFDSSSAGYSKRRELTLRVSGKRSWREVQAQRAHHNGLASFQSSQVGDREGPVQRSLPHDQICRQLRG